MNAITAINTVRDSLRTNLVDPYTYAGASDRGGSLWIFADEPSVMAKYPQIQIRKVDNPSEVLSIGPTYAEREFLYLNIWFYIKNGFKLIISGTEYKNASAVEYYEGLIKTTLKSQLSTLATAGVKGYAHLNTSTVGYDSETQLYFGAVSIRVEYFQDCS